MSAPTRFVPMLCGLFLVAEFDQDLGVAIDALVELVVGIGSFVDADAWLTIWLGLDFPFTISREGIRCIS